MYDVQIYFIVLKRVMMGSLYMTNKILSEKRAEYATNKILYTVRQRGDESLYTANKILSD